MFNKAHLKDGDLITLRGFKEKFYYTAGRINYGDWCICLEQYDDDLIFGIEDKEIEFDIMKVERYIKTELIYTLETLYERKEKKELLTKEEKEYLRNVIKPYRNKIEYITKSFDKGEEWIFIRFYDFRQSIILPMFKKNTMYKNMKAGKRYTLESLEL